MRGAAHCQTRRAATPESSRMRRGFSRDMIGDVVRSASFNQRTAESAMVIGDIDAGSIRIADATPPEAATTIGGRRALVGDDVVLW